MFAFNFYSYLTRDQYQSMGCFTQRKTQKMQKHPLLLDRKIQLQNEANSL